MRIIQETNIDFIRQKKVSFILSTFVILAGTISLVINGGPKLSIDFKGGTLVSVQYTEAMDVTAVRTAMGNVNIDGQSFDFSREEIKHFGGPSAVLIRVPHIEGTPQNFSQRIVDHLYSSFPEKVPESKTDFILGKGTVSPKIGSELSGKAVMAIISALGLILLYISIRFEFIFALGAIAALAHDVTITLGLFHFWDMKSVCPLLRHF